MTDDETIAVRATLIAGERYEDDFTVMWGALPVGSIMKRSGVPSRADLWCYGFTFYGPHSLGLRLRRSCCSSHSMISLSTQCTVETSPDSDAGVYITLSGCSGQTKENLMRRISCS